MIIVDVIRHSIVFTLEVQEKENLTARLATINYLYPQTPCLSNTNALIASSFALSGIVYLTGGEEPVLWRNGRIGFHLKESYVRADGREVWRIYIKHCGKNLIELEIKIHLNYSD